MHKGCRPVLQVFSRCEVPYPFIGQTLHRCFPTNIKSHVVHNCWLSEGQPADPTAHVNNFHPFPVQECVPPPHTLHEHTTRQILCVLSNPLDVNAFSLLQSCGHHRLHSLRICETDTNLASQQYHRSLPWGKICTLFISEFSLLWFTDAWTG